MGQEHWTHSAWLEGCNAARAGTRLIQNPYNLNEHGFNWHRSWANGWMFGNTQMRQERIAERDSNGHSDK